MIQDDYFHTEIFSSNIFLDIGGRESKKAYRKQPQNILFETPIAQFGSLVGNFCLSKLNFENVTASEKQT